MENKQVAKLTPIQTVLKKAQSKFDQHTHSLDSKREMFFASQIIKGNDMLESFVKSQPDGVISALVSVATLNLSLNPSLAFAYLVPRGGKCILDIGYRGLIKVLTDSGTVRNIDAENVYSNDFFDCEKGTDSFIKHKPKYGDRGEYIGTYAIGYFHDGGCQWTFLEDKEMNAIQKVSTAKDERYAPWKGDFKDEMRKKSAIKRLYKILPKTKLSDNVIGALEHDDKQNPVEFVKVDKNADLFDEAEIVPDEPIAKIDEPELPTDE